MPCKFTKNIFRSFPGRDYAITVLSGYIIF